MTEGAAMATTPQTPEPDSELREKCKTDLLLFAQTFFPQHCRLAFSKLHLDLIRRRQRKIAQPLEARRGQLDVVLAPRGSAKSTLVTLIFAAHAMLYGVERYIVIISATERQARQRLANLRAGLLQNPLLQARFPDRLSTFVRHNARSLELGEVKVDAFSAGGEMRGISHGPWRPTWIILDDAERSDRVDNARHREALADWFAEVVDNLGDAHTHIDIYVLI